MILVIVSSHLFPQINPDISPATNNLAEANPENHEDCPVKKPDPDLGPVSCDMTQLISGIDCQYNPHVCPGYDAFVGYASHCTCFDEGEGGGKGVLICAQAMIVCTDPPSAGDDDETNSNTDNSIEIPSSSSALTLCPGMKPNDGDACSFNNNNCRYTPRHCPDSTEIIFENDCTCTTAGIVMCTKVFDAFVVECHNTLTPKCPIRNPDGQSEECNIDDESITCNYNPAGCPETTNLGVFLTTCQCKNGEFNCTNSPPLDCDVIPEDDDLANDDAFGVDDDDDNDSDEDDDNNDFVDNGDEDDESSLGSPDNLAACPTIKPAIGSICDAGQILKDCYYSPVMCEGYTEPQGYYHLCDCRISQLIEEEKEESKFHCSDVPIICPERRHYIIPPPPKKATRI